MWVSKLSVSSSSKNIWDGPRYLIHPWPVIAPNCHILPAELIHFSERLRLTNASCAAQNQHRTSSTFTCFICYISALAVTRIKVMLLTCTVHISRIQASLKKNKHGLVWVSERYSTFLEKLVCLHCKWKHTWQAVLVRGVSGKERPTGKFFMLIVATPSSTLILYLWTVLVWQW